MQSDTHRVLEGDMYHQTYDALIKSGIVIELEDAIFRQRRKDVFGEQRR